MPQAIPLVRAVRSGLIESVHLGSVAVADVEGRLIAWAGDAGRVAFARSAMKPLQAAVSLELVGEDLTDPEVAVMCASHNGEPVHVAQVSALLTRAGLGFEALRTPPALPRLPEDARAVSGPSPELHNCSGKHAGMLLASARGGLDLETYRDPQHPVQQRVLAAVGSLAGDPAAIGVDGCGVPVHALPLVAMAALYARLVAQDGPGVLGEAAARAVAAMRAEPYLVGGRGRVCTAGMEAVDGAIVKVGAEGLICAGVAGRGVGIAVKIEDGAVRAQGPALLRALRLLDVLDDSALGVLAEHARPRLMGGNLPAGELVSDFVLVRR